MSSASSKPENRGTCRLCGREGPLCLSHIMPRFLYRGLQEGWTPRVEGPKLGTLRPGQVKEYLLCGECEGQFQQWEQTAGTFYHGICSLDAEALGEEVEFRGLNYQRLKLFYLSVIWRASVSCHTAMTPVSLGKREVLVETMVREANAGTTREFPVVGFVVRSSQEYRESLIAFPSKTRLCGMLAYCMYARGLAVYWMTSSQCWNRKIEERALREDGTWRLEASWNETAPIQAVEQAHWKRKRSECARRAEGDRIERGGYW